ncbi:MAG TPA: AprI/Inh family metalloprotease inhibitor [Xanthobacteraceae bacterium]
MNRDSIILIIVAIALSLCDVASAQDQQPNAAPAPPSSDAPPPSPPTRDDAVHAMIGVWEFSNADHDKICRFNFRTEAVAGGYRLDIDKNCPHIFASTKDIVAWSTDDVGAVRLLDAHGNAVIELSEIESGMYDGFRPEEGRYILQAAAATPMRSTDDMIGDWAIARGSGKTICMLTLAHTAAAGDTLLLQIKPGCDALVTRFGPTAWRLDRGDLLLLSARGQSWRFEESDANTWQRLPETPDPVLLVRQ